MNFIEFRDVVLLRPLENWYTFEQTNGNEINLLIGIEGDSPNSDTRMSFRPQQLSSWTFAAAPRHPFFAFMAQLILNKKLSNTNNYLSKLNNIFVIFWVLKYFFQFIKMMWLSSLAPQCSQTQWKLFF